MSGKKILLIMLLLLLVACGPAEAENNVSEPTAAADAVADEAESEQEEDSEHDDDHDHDEDDGAEHDEDDHREHEAHEHGVAEMTVAWSGQDLLIDLETPGFNVLGFEYEPATAAEKTLFAESVAALAAGDFLSFNAEADCSLLTAEVDSAHAAGDEHDQEDEAEHEEEAETHTDIDVAYTVRCENPAELTSLDLSGLFAQFSNFAELDVQWVSDTAQSAQELTPAEAVLDLYQ